MLKTRLMKRLRPQLAQPPYHGATALLLSVSGGLDSMTLLDVFVRCAHVHCAPIKVVHVNHHTGEFAEKACDLVRETTKKLGVDLHVRDWEWQGNGNFEYEAANFRRRAMEVLREEGAWVVLAHHAGDQAETILQTLVRGAGAATAIGMQSQREGRLRPFLNIDRDTLLDHARAAGVAWLDDPSNEDQTRFRNALRHTVVPTLKRFHGGFEANMAAWSEDLRDLQDQLNQAARRLFQKHYRDGLLARKAFNPDQPYLWDFLLKLFWEARGLAKPKKREHGQLRRWLKEGSWGSFDLGGQRCYLDLDGLTLLPPIEERDALFGENVDWGSWSFRLNLCEDLARQFGDSYHIARHESLPKKVKERLRLSRTPHRIREALPVFTLGGEVCHLHQVLEMERTGMLTLDQGRGECWHKWVRLM